jgi:hypothetical protein
MDRAYSLKTTLTLRWLLALSSVASCYGASTEGRGQQRHAVLIAGHAVTSQCDGRIPTDDKDMAATLPRPDAWLETAETLLKRFPPTLVTKGQRT